MICGGHTVPKKKQFRGVMTIGRGADLKKQTGIKLNRDICPYHFIPKRLGLSFAGKPSGLEIHCSEGSHGLKPLAAMACKAAQRQ